MGDLDAVTTFATIIDSHCTQLRGAGRWPGRIRISRTDAVRCGVADATEVLGLPVFQDNSVPLGYARLDMHDGAQYELHLPVWFTED